MKKKIIALLLTLTLLFSMSSCYLFDGFSLYYDGTDNKTETQAGGDTYVTIDEVKDYGDINITTTESQNVLAATKALLSAVSIVAEFEKTVYTSSGWGGFGGSSGQATTQTYHAMGSGVIYKLDKQKGDAYVITNYHVVYDADSNTQNHVSSKVTLYLYGQEYSDYAIPATYIGGSMQYDIAVLKVEASSVLTASNAVAADFADSDKISVLETAIAVGNPEGSGISATIGCVNVDSEYIDMTAADEKTGISLRVIRTDAAVNSGNSGGGLFNGKGELIGIVNAKVADSSVDNIGYAIPSNVAKYIADNIIYYCDGTTKECVYRCIVGITVETAEAYTDYDLETGRLTKLEKIKVQAVNEGAAAEGVLKAGDVINAISIDGKKYDVTRLYHVTDNMLNARPGSSITFHIVRDGAKTEVSMTMTDKMLVAYN